MVRKTLWSKGLRYRINYPITGKPDIVFTKKKIAIFVHGCFWHQHGCKNSVIPKTNTTFWREKLNGNKVRDKEVVNILRKEGWNIMTVWECEIKNNFDAVITKIIDFYNIHGKAENA